ncbi:uncharacterized protein N7443_004698 [Penicillium atrosanguineum]|uniref:uncharacterized protein n=1 Tax=Penicillium atrosanguineum TaxID=1132637 RepID=UPI00239C11AB|nr:uncharacterized protein N7443_004698 [Penicillium atrosanguineum]KAJ5133678.1 proline-specific permease [Penicillium atrosanguineum]KAJ5305038.1 hypothetical protein N7443_004698 [Penicillium atrosanguineum]
MPDDVELREGTFYIDRSAASSELSMPPAVLNERYDGPNTMPSLTPGPQNFIELLPLGPPPPSDSSQVISDTSGDSTGFKIGKTVTLSPFTVPADRTVRRSLKGIHLFMITINATLGTGLYWRGGQILELGGPLAVLLSFLLVGILSWAVMQCITEMLCIWPVPGALSVYVSKFVDEELGIAVGIAYWFTYSMSWSTIIATSAGEFAYWDSVKDNQSFHGLVIYLAIPFVLVCINAFSIEIYGFLEVLTGSLKIIFLAIIVVTLIAISVGAGPVSRSAQGSSNWAMPTAYDKEAAENWPIALLMSISVATFAYVGIEVIATCALEARWPRESTDGHVKSDTERPNGNLIGKTVKFSAIFISVLATAAYTLGGVLGTLDIARDDSKLPRLGWLETKQSTQNTTTNSSFVLIAAESKIPHLADIFNVFLVFTCLSCAGTNLYIASRTLFGLASRLEGGSKGKRGSFLRILAWFGKTNSRNVPLRAMILSAVAFGWVPFLQLIGGGHSSVNTYVDVLSEMASLAVLIVWACECLAFIRYYNCISRFRNELEDDEVAQVRRWSTNDWHDYPYRSHGQPVLAYLALAGCIFVLIIANGAALWKGWHLLPFLSAYLTIAVFLGLWVFLKLARGASWSWEDLSSYENVSETIQYLHEIRFSATQPTSTA